VANVTLAGVWKRYRSVDAVVDVELDIADGELLVLVGPSGCGKTTLLRLIAGLEMPDRGAVLFDGQDMTAVAPAERNIAMVFEGYALYPHMAVRDNLSFALRLRRTPPAEVDQRVADVAAAMELGRLLGRRPGGLATGEAQQVAVGRAVIRQTPAVLLLDDALAHLDARQRLEARVELEHLHRDLGCTVVSVTHDQAEALAIGSRVAVMDAGRLMQVGTPHELYERPADVFVAGFVGSPPMNLIEMRLAQEDGRATLRRGPLAIAHPEDARPASGSAITLGFRPQDVRLAPASSAAELGLRGRCELVEYLGPRLLVHVRLDGDEILVMGDPSAGIRPGDLVDCSLPHDRLHLFDTETGLALRRSGDVPSSTQAMGAGR